jgi:hypothetical protein
MGEYRSVDGRQGVIQRGDQQRKAGIACRAGGLGKIIAGEAGTSVSSSQSGIVFAAP